MQSAIKYESPAAGRKIAPRDFIAKPITLEEIGLQSVLERLTNKVQEGSGAVELPQPDAAAQTETEEQAREDDVAGLQSASLASQELADDELLFQDALDDTEKPEEAPSNCSMGLTPDAAMAQNKLPAIIDRSYIMLHKIDCS